MAVAVEKSNVLNRVMVVHDGVEALDYLFATGPYAERGAKAPPAVILLDLNLPKMAGLDVLRRLRADERTRRIPVVVLTSSNEEEDILTSYDLGANSFVRKPVDFARFVVQIFDDIRREALAIETKFRKFAFQTFSPSRFED